MPYAYLGFPLEDRQPLGMGLTVRLTNALCRQGIDVSQEVTYSLQIPVRNVFYITLRFTLMQCLEEWYEMQR